MTRAPATPGLGKRLLGLVYEALLLIAVILLAGGMASGLAQLSSPDHARAFTRILVVIACTGYFAWQWHCGGQTLPMKTWRIRLETASGDRVPLSRALLRVLLATAGYGLAGISVLWALFDRDHQFLHDRLAGTRLVRTG